MNLFADRFRALLIAATVLALSSGCGYLDKRGQDALDVVELGATVSFGAIPQPAVWFDAGNVLSMGYADVDGQGAGLFGRQVGWMPLIHDRVGLLIYGAERGGAGRFSPTDPHQLAPNLSAGTTWPKIATGILAVIVEKEHRPHWVRYGGINLGLHLGWLGLRGGFNGIDLVDFLVGWTTLDIVGDDGPVRSVSRVPEPRPMSPREKEKAAAKRVDEAYEALNQNDWATAQSCLDALEKIDPDSTALYTLRKVMRVEQAREQQRLEAERRNQANQQEMERRSTGD